MRAGLLFRIAIYTLAISAVYMLATSGVYYLQIYFKSSFGAEEFSGSSATGVLAYFLMPLLFAFVGFAFAGNLEGFLLGSAANERADFAGGSHTLLAMGLKLLGVYFISAFVGPLVATIYELLAVRVENPAVSAVQINHDMLLNLVGMAAGFLLCTQTSRIARALNSDSALPPPPSPPPQA